MYDTGAVVPVQGNTTDALLRWETGMASTCEICGSGLSFTQRARDAIQIHQSNRQSPSMFRVSRGPMVAAAIHAATLRLL